MIVSLKDSLKLIGIIIVIFCATFVCTFFLNFYIDAQAIKDLINDAETLTLYKAQMATATFTSAISGGFLAVIAIIMLAFYIKLYIDKNLNKLGILKAMGYSNLKIASSFLVFGISVFLGAALGFGMGFAIMPVIYESMSIGGLPEITINFHFWLLIALVIVPTVLFAVFAFCYALLALKIPVCQMLRGRAEKVRKYVNKQDKEHSFLSEMCYKTIVSKKTIAFFIAFACFCFSSMVQMSVSMLDLSSELMGGIILGIGIVLAVTTIFMAVTTLMNGNLKNIAMMKAFGYTNLEIALSILGGYHIFALTGFALGTVYQYGILSVMVNFVFKEVGSVPDYSFDVVVFFITLAVFIAFYECVMLFYFLKMNKVSVKSVMIEN